LPCTPDCARACTSCARRDLERGLAPLELGAADEALVAQIAIALEVRFGLLHVHRGARHGGERRILAEAQVARIESREHLARGERRHRDRRCRSSTLPATRKLSFDSTRARISPAYSKLPPALAGSTTTVLTARTGSGAGAGLEQRNEQRRRRRAGSRQAWRASHATLQRRN
jgi:hypothetical protein